MCLSAGGSSLVGSSREVANHCGRSRYRVLFALVSQRAQQKTPRSRSFATLGFKWRGQDLNLRPRGYEPRELPGCSTPRHVLRRPTTRQPPRVIWILALVGRWSRGVAAIYMVATHCVTSRSVSRLICDNSQNRLIRTLVEDHVGSTGV